MYSLIYFSKCKISQTFLPHHAYILSFKCGNCNFAHLFSLDLSAHHPVKCSWCSPPPRVLVETIHNEVPINLQSLSGFKSTSMLAGKLQEVFHFGRFTFFASL
ncbi:hypothetical protein CW304_26040 [Bacillus sp. UFRGS-B20]|nr:hypothetical protein CW304_26040 [Bacillus sp. UFRGS-B20]